MFTHLVRAAALAAVALGVTAQAQAAGTVTLISSPMYWSSNGGYADFVLRYDPRAVAALTVSKFYVADLNGVGTSQTLMTCGTGVKSGDTIVAHRLAPGQYCWVRAYHTPNNIIAKAVLNDGSGVTTNIRAYTRASIESRDSSDNVITHVEVR